MASGSGSRYPKRDIDANDVERGCYVHAQLCEQTPNIVYVGKGYGERAWSTNRADDWHEIVEALPDSYEAKLLHVYLTEAESVYHEKQEIAANGGAAAVDGILLKWLPEEATYGGLCLQKLTPMGVRAVDACLWR